jgi:hypothetical protein
MRVTRVILTGGVLTFGALALSIAAVADNPIPDGVWGNGSEVCKLNKADNNMSMAELRGHFGALAFMIVEGSNVTFIALPGDCDVKSVKNTGGNIFQVKMDCDMKTRPEDVLFSVEIESPDSVVLSVVQGPREGWFTPDFKKKKYIRCGDITRSTDDPDQNK